MTRTRRITVACSPDADDLFMMRALLEERIDTGRYRFEITSAPTDALNRIASTGEGPDVVALSIAHYPRVAQTYQLLPHGGSMGEGYGPVLVTPSPTSLDALKGQPVAVPGLTTTAWMVLQMILDAQPVVVPITPYGRIFEALRAGEVRAGLIIHEGRLTYEAEGMHAVIDIGVWWAEQTGGLPLPLGGNAIRRDLEDKAEVSALLKASIAHALADRDAAIDWLIAKGSALRSREQVGTYLDMYANGRTLDYGDAGREGIRELFRRAGVPVTVDFSP